MEVTSSLVQARLPQASDIHRLAFVVPADAPLGMHRIEARFQGGEANASFEVVQAPSRLVVTGPIRVPVHSGTMDFEVRVRTPLPSRVGEGPVEVRGDRSASAPLEQGKARIMLPGPTEPGTLRLTFHYPGSNGVAPAQAAAAVEVEGAAPAALQDAGEEPPLPSPALPALLRVAVVAGVVLLLAAAVAWLRRTTPGPSAGPAPLAASPAPPAPPTAAALLRPRHVVAAMVLFLRALRRRGVATPDLTVREAAARAGDPVLSALVAPFERVRYGGKATPVPPSLLDRAAARVRAWTEGSR